MRTLFLSTMAVAIQVVPGLATIRYTSLLENFYVNDVYIDMDLDGDDDFAFYYGGGDHVVSCLKPTSYFAANTFDEPKAYSEGAQLGTFQWVSTNGGLNLFDGTDKFLMVKFNDTSGNTYYGWFRIVDAGTQYYLSGFAYEDVPGQSILPGATGSTGIYDMTVTGLRVYTNESGFVSFTNCADVDMVTVQTIDGRMVATIKHPIEHTPYPIASNGVLVFTMMRDNQRLRSLKSYLP